MPRSLTSIEREGQDLCNLGFSIVGLLSQVTMTIAEQQMSGAEDKSIY
jgi:hypothetical protein